MNGFLGEKTRRMVQDCVKKRREWEQIVEEYLEASDEYRDGHKRKNLSLELKIVIEKTILIQLEKELLAS